MNNQFKIKIMTLNFLRIIQMMFKITQKENLYSKSNNLISIIIINRILYHSINQIKIMMFRYKLNISQIIIYKIFNNHNNFWLNNLIKSKTIKTIILKYPYLLA